MYELIFETDPIEEPLQDKIDEQFDALISTQGSTFFVTLEVDGPSAAAAALTGATALEQLGVRVRRLSEDLVTRTDIAERANKTPQAVGAWVRGDRQRQAAAPFPAPYNYVAGGVWLWGEVNEWLARVHPQTADEISYPSREDHTLVNHMLDNRRALKSSTVVNLAWTTRDAWTDASAATHVVMSRESFGSRANAWSASVAQAHIDESWDSFTLAG